MVKSNAGDVMEKQSIIKKIFYSIANLFKVILIMILNLIRSLFGKSKNTDYKTITKINTHDIKENIDNGNKINSNINTGLPDEDHMKSNPHEDYHEDEDSTNDVFLELPRYKLNHLNKRIDDGKVNYLTYELVSKFIDEELEEIYKEQKFKVKDAPKEIEEKIKELKKEIVPKIVDKINNNILVTKDEVKKEVKKTLDEKLKEKPILVVPLVKEVTVSEDKSLESKKKDTHLESKTIPNKEDTLSSVIVDSTVKDVRDSNSLSNRMEEDQNKVTKEDIYFVAKPRKKDLNIPSNKPFKAHTEDKVVTMDDSATLDKKMADTPIMMVQNVEVIPKPTIQDTVAKAAITSTILAADLAREMFGSTKEDRKDIRDNENGKKEDAGVKKEQVKKAEKPQVKEEVTAESLDIKGITSIQGTKDDLEHDTKSIQELAELQAQLEAKIEEIKKEEAKDSSKEAQDVVKDLMKDTEISAITQTSEAIIDDSVEETKKEEFEDKDYDRIERQIDKMLEDISNTYLRYEEKMTPKQKAKLEAEESKLRATREQIRSQKSHDLTAEQNVLNEEIHYSEIKGLQDELERIDSINKAKVSEEYLRKMDHLEGMTQEQVAQADKRVMLKRFSKASTLLEMGSILALPFVRNKFFFAFTVGLIIDNHFNFVNAFFKRRINRYEPADLSQIKRGQDALNGALDITYKNLVELDYLEQQALDRYPELAYDPEFIKQVTRLRTNLNQKYNKLMKKNKTMEKYYMKSKYQAKVLKKDLKPEQK